MEAEFSQKCIKSVIEAGAKLCNYVPKFCHGLYQKLAISRCVSWCNQGSYQIMVLSLTFVCRSIYLGVNIPKQSSILFPLQGAHSITFSMLGLCHAHAKKKLQSSC